MADNVSLNVVVTEIDGNVLAYFTENISAEAEQAVIDEALCNLCGTCVSVCPQGAIKQEDA